MNVQKLPSDFIGLSQVMPPLSRRGFMSNAAAAAAGYTLAAGPVRADAIQTDAKGLNAGMATVAISGGDMPVYFARPANVVNPPGYSGLHGSLRPARVGQGHHPPGRPSRRLLRSRRIIISAPKQMAST